MKAVRILLFLGTLAWAVSCVAQGSAVHESAQAGDLARLKELIGASPELVDAKDEDNGTPLHTAAMMGRMEANSAIGCVDGER